LPKAYAHASACIAGYSPCPASTAYAPNPYESRLFRVFTANAVARAERGDGVLRGRENPAALGPEFFDRAPVALPLPPSGGLTGMSRLPASQPMGVLSEAATSVDREADQHSRATSNTANAHTPFDTSKTANTVNACIQRTLARGAGMTTVAYRTFALLCSHAHLAAPYRRPRWPL
jgi:hypothetical protein